jgi:ribonuclease P protein component
LLAGPRGAPEVQRLKTRAQFEAVMAGSTVSRTVHFALHRTPLDTPPVSAGIAPTGPASEELSPQAPTGPGSAGPATDSRLSIAPAGRESARPKPLFAVREAWIGALVPKRWAKRAVTRNAIKRQIYNVSKEMEPQLPAAAHVVRLRAGFDRDEYVSASSQALKRAVRGELQELFAKAAP